MTPNVTNDTEERLTLRPSLSEIVRLLPWIERLAAQYAIPDNVRFAGNLCLEEVLSNIILHGYRGKAEGAVAESAVVVRFAMPRSGCFVFIVEDEAPHFNPLDQPELPALNPSEETQIGGQGLRLVLEFADALEYERLPVGNRFKMSFSAVPRPDSQNGCKRAQAKDPTDTC